MRLYEIETTPDNRNENIQLIAKTIIADCAPYLDLVRIQVKRPHWLYRGMKTTENSISGDGKLTPCVVRKKDRSPRNSKLLWHQYIDEWLVDNVTTTWRPRSGALFTTQNIAETEIYGVAHVVFPIGNFDYLFSDVIIDMTESVSAAITVDKEFNEENRIAVDDMLENASWHLNNSFNSSSAKYSEIIINADTYYALPKYSSKSDNEISFNDIFPTLQTMYLIS